MQIVLFLICFSTDAERVSLAADKQLQEIGKKNPGFIHIKSLQGIRLSYQLQSLIERNLKENSPAQSASVSNQQYDICLFSFKFDGLLIIALLIHKSALETPNKKSGPKCCVASAIQESQGIARGFRLKEGEHSSLFATKQQRRALVFPMLKQFDDTSKNPLAQLLYLADKLTSFQYKVFWKKVSQKCN